jgi:hypothetical protein
MSVPSSLLVSLGSVSLKVIGFQQIDVSGGSCALPG